MAIDPFKDKDIETLRQRLIEEAIGDPGMTLIVDKYQRGDYTWEETATELAMALWLRGNALGAKLTERDGPVN